MTPDEAFKELTRRSGPILREHGFKGSGQNFKRDLTDIWQGINFQKTQWRSDASHPVSFTLNLTLSFPRMPSPRPSAAAASFDKFSPMKADQTFRVGDFLPEGDTWWDVDAADLENLWPRFAAVLTDTVIPAMNTMKTREGLADVCRTMPWNAFGPLHLWLAELAPPPWNPKDRDAGLWKQDDRGRWWGPGEW